MTPLEEPIEERSGGLPYGSRARSAPSTPPTANVGAGAVWLTIANLWHGVAGFAIYVAAARLLSTAEFGTLSVVMAIALAIEVFLIQGLPKGVARGLPMLTEHLPAAARPWVRSMLALSFAFGAVLFALLWVGASALGQATGRPEMVPLLRLAGLDFIAFAGFVIWVSVFNGLHRYGTQAAIMMAYSAAKMIAVVALIYWRPEPAAGVWGYVIGSALGTLIAGCAVGWLRPFGGCDSTPPPSASTRLDLAVLFTGKTPSDSSPNGDHVARFHRAVLNYAVPLSAFAFLSAVLLNIDLVLAKAWFAPPEAGIYAGAVQVARMVYFVFLAFSEALFPAVAQAVARRDLQLSAAQIRRGLALLALLLLPTAGLGFGLASPTLSVVLGPEYAAGAGVLQGLIVAAAALVTLNVLGAALAARGHAWQTCALVLMATAATLLGGILFLQSAWPAGPPFLEGLTDLRFGIRLALIPAGAAAVAALLAAILLRLSVPALRYPALDALFGLAGALFLALVPPLWAPLNWWLIPYGVLWMALFAAAAYPRLKPVFGGDFTVPSPPYSPPTPDP